jgi:hypothetical protein
MHSLFLCLVFAACLYHSNRVKVALKEVQIEKEREQKLAAGSFILTSIVSQNFVCQCICGVFILSAYSPFAVRNEPDVDADAELSEVSPHSTIAHLWKKTIKVRDHINHVSAQLKRDMSEGRGNGDIRPVAEAMVQRCAFLLRLNPAARMELVVTKNALSGSQSTTSLNGKVSSHTKSQPPRKHNSSARFHNNSQFVICVCACFSG